MTKTIVTRRRTRLLSIAWDRPERKRIVAGMRQAFPEHAFEWKRTSNGETFAYRIFVLCYCNEVQSLRDYADTL